MASNWAAERQQRFSREITKETARDRTAMEEIHRGLERLEVERALELSSVRRAQEASRRSFAERVRQSRTGSVLGDPVFFGATAENRLNRRLTTLAKGQLKSGLKIGLTGLAAGALTEAMPNSGGFAGAAGRILGAAGSGAVYGSMVPGVGTSVGAITGALSALVQEAVRSINDLYEMGSKLKEEIEERRKEIEDLERKAKDNVLFAKAEIQEEIEEGLKKLAEDMVRTNYRTSRWVHQSLTGN
jgi:hypothetical protein